MNILNTKGSRSTLTRFGGYRAAERTEDGQWRDMSNLSSRAYPLLCTRDYRGEEKKVGALQALTGGYKSAMVADDCLYYGGELLCSLAADRYELLLSEPDDFALHPERYFADTGGTRVSAGTPFESDRYYRNDFVGVPRTVVPMGALLTVFPDKRQINTVTGKSRFLEQVNTNAPAFSGDVLKRWTFAPCDGTGRVYERVVYALTESAPEDFTESYADYYQWDGEAYVVNDSPLWRPGIMYRRYDAVGTTCPASPCDGDVWIDTGDPDAPVTRRYSATMQMWVSVTGVYFKITGEHLTHGFAPGDGVRLSGAEGEREYLNGDYIIESVDAGSMVLQGVLRTPFTTADEVQDHITVSRTVPEMDFVIEAENRLWGCRYGLGSDGGAVNEIYACKQGDATNWHCYAGLSTDSYAVSLGSDGPFTGAVFYGGYPTFFKEGYIHRIGGSSPSSYRLYTTVCDGVGQDCGGSIAEVDGTLYYKSPTAVMAYGGSYPRCVSYELGDEVYTHAVAGAVGGKYYLCQRGEDGTPRIFVYDTVKGLWHIEDGCDVQHFARVGPTLYMGTKDSVIPCRGKGEAPFNWYAQSGVLGAITPEQGYVAAVCLRAGIEDGGELRLYIEYDSSGVFEFCGGASGGVGSTLITLTPRRCDHYALRLEGRGQCRVYSLTTVTEKGGDMA